MKRGMAVLFAIALVLGLTACSGGDGLPKPLDKEGVAPYALSAREKHLLQALNLEDSTLVLEFLAPEGAISLDVHVYQRVEGEAWKEIGGGGISIGEERIPTDKLNGTFSMRLAEDHSIDFSISDGSGGRASYKTEGMVLESEALSSSKSFLPAFESVALNTEIPVALMVRDDGTKMVGYTLQDFFDSAKFEGLDFVQAVTLEFSDK